MGIRGSSQACQLGILQKICAGWHLLPLYHCWMNTAHMRQSMLGLLDVHEFLASLQVLWDRVIDVVCAIQFTGVHISICLCWGKYTSIII